MEVRSSGRCFRPFMKIAAFLFAFTAVVCAQQTKSEPTNAKEAAEKKAAADKAIDEKYQVWKASLPSDQQKWETILEANLGSFYLPIHKAEKVQGQSNAWDFVQDDPKLPRVLLIGDSISRAYTLTVRKALAGKANVHRAPENCGPTANGLKKIDIWLGEGSWDIIHFNFGIHDRRTAVEAYKGRLEQLIAKMKPRAKQLIWANTTPVPADTKDGPAMPAAIEERNSAAAEVMKKHGIAINDLNNFIRPQLAGLANPQDVHFSARGNELLGQQVAKVIGEALK